MSETGKFVRKWRYPIWYYGMIFLAVAGTAAGAYFRGKQMQGGPATDRITLGIILTALCSLSAWAFHTILDKVDKVGKQMARLTDSLFMMEMKFHPEHAELIMKTALNVKKENGNGDARGQSNGY